MNTARELMAKAERAAASAKLLLERAMSTGRATEGNGVRVESSENLL